MPQVSVIVPVYQVQKYIGCCIESILQQTFSDFELILVDDGSTDLSGAICDQYAARDSRIRVIHKKNAGVAAARNTGIEACLGKYVCFVDADDRIDVSLLKSSVEKMEEKQADVLRHGYVLELWKDGKVSRSCKEPAPDFTDVLTHEQIAGCMEKFWENCSNYVWNYFFTRASIGKIRFPQIPISEDHIFVLKVLEKAKRIAFLAETPYYYCMRMGSTANRWSKDGIYCQLKMVQACDRFMESFGIKSPQKDQLIAPKAFGAYSYTIYLLSFPNCKLRLKEKMRILRSIRKKLEINRYRFYAKNFNQGFADLIKTKLICLRQEWIMVLIGPYFMRLVHGSR